MAEIIISSYFADNSGPVTGLTPTIRIWEVTSTGQDLVVGATCGSGQNTDGNMVEMGDCGSPVTELDGFYRFTFTDLIGYDITKSYVVRADGGVTLSAEFRYQAEKITTTDAIDAQFIEDAVWDAAAANHIGGSPDTMGELQNLSDDIFNTVEVIRTNDIPALYSLMDYIRKYNTNRTKIDAANNTLTIYEDDCVTVLRVFRLLDSTGTPSTEEVCERTSIDGTVDGSSPSGSTGDDGFPTCSTANP